MKQLCVFLCLFVIAFSNVYGQTSTKTINGKVIESNNQLPLEFVTIIIMNSTNNTPISGTTTDETGSFSLKTTAPNFYIEARFIGFKTKKITQFNYNASTIKLPTITLEENSDKLDEVIVRAEKSQTVFKLDKRVFNVGKDLSSTGASALEILNNVPSVTVNIEGQISLRGSQGVQILINGKPSVLASEEGNALGSITADMIESIEVITNPSAKYDASGTSGILNIILKKSEKKGLNGSISLNTGIPNNHSLGLSLNRRTEKFNLFSQVAYGRRTFPRKGNSSSTNTINNTQLSTISNNNKNENFFNLILGTDYHINANNVLTLSGHYAFENEKENANQTYSLNDAISTTDSWNRKENTTATNPKWEYELQYKKDFTDRKKHNLLFSALGTSFSKDKTSNFTNNILIGNMNNALQEARTNFGQNEYTFKLDYTRPIYKNYILEIGAQYLLDQVTNTYTVRDFINNNWITNTGFSNVFDYNQGVLGTYATFAFEDNNWGIKGGLRLENTNLTTKLITTNQNNKQRYSNLFPSLHSSYKVNDNLSLQAGYSKRIFRPRLWDLNPFVSFRDNFNLNIGNPNLTPEFTNSFEITTIYKLSKASINAGIYHRATTDVIEEITTINNNVTTSKPQNIGTNRATGLEINTKYSPISWFSFTSDFNYNTFIRKGQLQNNNFDFTGNRWSLRTTGKIKFPAGFTLEATGNYRSQFKTAQSTISDNLFMNLGIRKKMLNGKLNASLSIRDVFASRNYEEVTVQNNFTRTAFSQRGRFVTLGVSFGFGKGEAMEFSGQKRF